MVAEFFWSLDIPVYEGYGLTETCVATNVDRPANHKIGSVGQVLEEVEIKLALRRGSNVSRSKYCAWLS